MIRKSGNRFCEKIMLKRYDTLRTQPFDATLSSGAILTRVPPPSELGFDVTIAMAAITKPDGYIVTVSDRMISYDDITQAQDDATLKAQRVADSWGVMFAGNDARQFSPLVDKIIPRLDRMKRLEQPFSLENVKTQVMEAYQELFDEEFSAAFLSRLRIPNLTEFRKMGLLSWVQMCTVKFTEKLQNST